MKIPIVLILFALGLSPALSQAQIEPTALQEALDSLAKDTLAYYEADYDSAYAHVQYTRKPGELSVTEAENQKKYASKKFSKTEWKRIVGNTNYAEETQEKTAQPKEIPDWNIDPLILKVAGYVIIFGLLAYLIYLFVKQALKDSDKKIRSQQTALFSDQATPADVQEVDLEKLLREALAQNNLRLAVRLYYIKLLNHLNTQGYIRWEKNKTNRDYAEELALFGFSREFRKLMVAYEYVWYGERTPSAEEFSALEMNFRDLYKAQRT